MKRKMFVFVVCLLAGVSASARDYLPMLKDGKRWMYYYTNNHYECNTYYTLKGDTVFNDNKWYKVYQRTVDQWTGTELIGEQYVGAMREEAGRVYHYAKGKNSTDLLCDFNLEVGDEGKVTEYYKWRVSDISYIYVLGTTRKCLTISWKDTSEAMEWKEYWVEGIGSSRTFMNADISFRVCYEDDRCIFTSACLADMPTTKVTPEQDQLVSEGRQWWYRNSNPYISVNGVDSRMVLKGDTVIVGKVWKKLYYIETPGSVPVYAKALREEGGRVYELQRDGHERLLLDFTLGIGDRYVPGDGRDKCLEVIAVDTLLSAGIARRRLVLQQYVNNVETNLTTWTEGVGSECGIDQPALWSDMGTLYQNGHHTSDYYWQMFSGSADKDGNCIYGTIPSNETGVIMIPYNAQPDSHTFDLHGRRLQGKPGKGMYIENGRKVIVK